MDEIIIRTATSNDLDTLLQYEQMIIKTERPFDSTLGKGQISYYDLKGMIDMPDVEIAVAELNSKVIGSGYARIENSKSYNEHKQHAYLGFMYVDPGYRGKGVNKMIIGFLKSWIKSKNINELRLDVYVGNSSAIRAYEKIGFAPHMLEMRMGIDEG